MRKKLIEAEPAALLDHELIEMILLIAIPRRDAKTVVNELLARFVDLAGLLSAPPQELREIEGLGDAGIGVLRIIYASALRLGEAQLKNKPVLTNWNQLTAYLNARMSRERVEQFRVLFLDTKNRLIADETQARGTVNHTPVYPREIVKRALELYASALILVHNHPSGDTTPSRADIVMTQEVKRAAAALNITLHDHLIVGRGPLLSFQREGLL